MEQIFAYLFKYRPFYFSEGSLSFSWPVSAWWFLAAAAGALALVLWLYREQIRRPGRSGWILAGLRIALLIGALLLLARPTLTLSTLVPQESLVAVLVDNSKSMSIEDGARKRSEQIEPLLEADSDFRSRLEDQFLVRWMKFDREAAQLQGSESLDWQGEQTNIRAGLEKVLAETRNLPLAGVVLITDGSDNSFRDLRETVDQLSALDIPVHTVGVGPEELTRDLEILQVSLPDKILPDSVAVARVVIRHPGYGGSRGRLVVRDGSTLVSSQEVYFSRESMVSTVEVKLIPTSAGVKAYDFSVEPLEGEQLAENNSRRTILEVRDQAPRALLVEGRPRWEYKFLRQALSGDRFVRLESLLRTALNKFYRQGIEEETTLASGFPATREELFAYKGLILGDVESAFFSYQQMEMIRDFVSERGGGFLMLGGGSTLSEGSYENTPVEEILPVWLDGADQRMSTRAYLRTTSEVALTDYGLNHPALQLSADDSSNEAVWSELPSISDRNLVSELKPGATVLARAVPEGELEGGASPLLVSHRFGRGLGIVFLSGSSWRWQMLQDHTDQSHERFWRQVIRWLVSSAKDPVSVEVERDVYSRNEPVQFRAEVNDESFTRINDARVEARVYFPGGTVEELRLRWDAREDGVYQGSLMAREDGLYRVEVDAWSGAEAEEAPPEYGSAQTNFLTLTGQAEFFDATQKKEFLMTLADQTGGRYYEASEAGRLPEEIRYSEARSSVVEVLELWNMPINFLILLGLLAGEWIYRRRQGII